MPYKDAERPRAAKREWKARQRAAGGTRGRTPGRTLAPLLPLAVRLENVADVLALVRGQVGALLADETLSTAERARAVGYLCGLALRCVEVGELAARLEELERLVGAGEVAA